MHVARARVDHAVEISDLIRRSKAYWDWPQAYLQAALPLMAVSPGYIRDNTCLEVFIGDEVVGFASLVVEPGGALLDNLWVEPNWIGHGVGMFTCDEIFRIARVNAWNRLTTLPDPPSEGFYVRVGFQDTGVRVPSRVTQGPVFSIYEKLLSGATT